MTTTHDLTALSDAELQHRVTGLIGQPFGGARASYGGELRVSFGPAPERGSRWELGTRAARWILLGERGVLARESDGTTGLAAFRELEGTHITSVDATRADRTLALAVDSGHRLVVLPNKPHRSKDDLDLWELFTPYGWWLAVRRDGSVELVPDDMPLAERHQRRHAA